ncbi:ATP-binding protein [Thalassotalea psychrophila]|uniref:histidine kinase n=1 Tax=Thalassotalea psychrophila TaxID=3065647 RepID=A0ABY9TUI6_9GAMM|nr:ATP-binding protein [Colwelliaceae bacterium SQ149]
MALNTQIKGWFNSLQARVMVSALLMILIILPSIAIILNNAFTEQVQSSIQNELIASSYSILALAEVDNQQLQMPEQLLNNQFNASGSGLYALMVKTDNTKQNTIWSSPSFIGLTSPNTLPTPAIGESRFSKQVIDNKNHLVYSFTVSFIEQQQAFTITLHIVKDQSGFAIMVAKFQQTLWTWLGSIMAVLLILQFFLLKFTLRPLSKLQKELKQIEQGNKHKIEHQYPLELARVSKQLNTLLTAQKNQRKRYRNALSDLAHSLKNPLAVMQSQGNLTTSSLQQLSLMNKTIEHQLKRAQSGGETAWHVGIKIEPIAKKLVNSLHKIYQQKDLVINSVIDEKAIFNGEESDLFEILGNLLDNACKAANKAINLHVTQSETQLTLSISDDGSGISTALQENILQRGTRADTYQQGHGIGLAIVRDLVSSYQGNLTIDHSHELGGALFTITFKR